MFAAGHARRRTPPTAANTPPTTARPALAATVTVVLWASAFVAIRALGDTFSPGSMALLRLLAAVIPLSVVLLVVRRRSSTRKPLFPRGRALAQVIAYGVAWFGGYMVLLNWAERHLDAGTAALLVNLAPILVAVYAGLFMGEGFPRHLVAGLALAFGGVVLIALGASAGSSAHSDWLGIVLGLATAVLYALGVLLQKSALSSVDALTATWLGALAGLVSTAPFAPVAVAELGDAAPADVWWVIYLGVGPTAIAFTTWAYALARTQASTMAATTLVVPAIVVGMSWLFLGELPAVVGLVGGALCLLGVAVARGLLRRRTPRPVLPTRSTADRADDDPLSHVTPGA